MNLFCKCLLLLFIVSSAVRIVSAQNKVEVPVLLSIPTLSLVGFAGSDNFTYNTGNGAEQIITPSTLDKTWINYSSVVDENSTNIISVSLSPGNYPAEITINLEVGPDAGAGAGTTGMPTGKIALTTQAQEIITGIGSCYTGQGVKKGHQLKYTWDWLPPYDLNHSLNDNMEVSVIYTLTSTK